MHWIQLTYCTSQPSNTARWSMADWELWPLPLLSITRGSCSRSQAQEKDHQKVEKSFCQTILSQGQSVCGKSLIRWNMWEKDRPQVDDVDGAGGGGACWKWGRTWTTPVVVVPSYIPLPFYMWQTYKRCFTPLGTQERWADRRRGKMEMFSGLKLEKPNSRNSSMGQQTNKENYLHEMIKWFAVIWIQAYHFQTTLKTSAFPKVLAAGGLEGVGDLSWKRIISKGTVFFPWSENKWFPPSLHIHNLSLTIFLLLVFLWGFPLSCPASKYAIKVTSSNQVRIQHRNYKLMHYSFTTSSIWSWDKPSWLPMNPTGKKSPNYNLP